MLLHCQVIENIQSEDQIVSHLQRVLLPAIFKIFACNFARVVRLQVRFWCPSGALLEITGALGASWDPRPKTNGLLE